MEKQISDGQHDLLDRNFTKVFIWLGAFIYPFWGWICQSIDPSVNDSFLMRAPIGVLLFLLSLPIHFSKISTKATRHILLFAAIVLTFHFFYILSINRLSIMYSAGIIVHLIGTCSALINATEVVVYILVTSVVLAGMLVKSALPFEIGLILNLTTLYFYFFLGAFYRFRLLKRMQQQKLSNLASESVALQVAHDMRAPVATLNFLKSKTKSEVLDQDDQKLFGMALERLGRISAELLNQFRQMKMNQKSEINLSQVLVQLTNEAKSRGAGIEFELKNPDSTLTIEGNLNHFERGISNILNNSIESFEKSAAGSKSKISIEVLPTKKKYNFAIQIKDNGRGIPPEIAKQLLKTTVTHGKEHGTGIGLFTSQKLLEEFDFRLEIQSVLDQGTTIILKRKRPFFLKREFWESTLN